MLVHASHLYELFPARLVKELVEEDGGVCQLREEALVQLHSEARQTWQLARLAAPHIRVRHLCCAA